jgi:hypothetical protein
MTARFTKMMAKLPQFKNFYKVVVNATPTSQIEMEQNIQVYERNSEGNEVIVASDVWGFSYDDVIAKDAEIKAEAMTKLREQRNALLAETDKITMSCYSRGIPVPTEWATYQQALRDLPEVCTPDFADNGSLIGFDFPVQPTSKP